MADNQMDWIGEKVETKTGKNGVGVSGPEKNAIIELAHGVWKDMGLSKKQIAAGIATFNVESGFNPLAEQTTKKRHYVGLGQFDEATWKEAVDKYNENFNEDLDPNAERHDILSQIKVSGAWMKYRLWSNAVYYSADPSLEGNSLQEIVYGLWHEGASIKDRKVDKLKNFLEGTDAGEFMNKKGDLSGSFNDTYNSIYDELQLRDEADTNSDNTAPQAQRDEANKNLWDAVIEGLKKFLNEPGTQNIIRQFIDQQGIGKYPLDRGAAWQIEKAETGENPDESLES